VDEINQPASKIFMSSAQDLQAVILLSKRLSLRSFTPEDAPTVFSSVTPQLTRFLPFDPSPSPEAFAEVWQNWLKKMADGTDLSLVVRLALSGEFIGMTGLHGIGNPAPEIGLWIKEEAHSFGYGREVVTTVLAWASEKCGAKGITYSAVEENWASRRIAESLNGTIIGTRQHRKSADVEHALVIYQPVDKLPRPHQTYCI
jgi:RimJ/RimL family protein N-acetyltransferase